MSLRDGGFGYHDLERAALGFVLESETFPVFLAWAAQNGVTTDIAAWLESPDLEEARTMYLEHSPDALLKTLGTMRKWSEE